MGITWFDKFFLTTLRINRLWFKATNAQDAGWSTGAKNLLPLEMLAKCTSFFAFALKMLTHTITTTQHCLTSPIITKHVEQATRKTFNKNRHIFLFSRMREWDKKAIQNELANTNTCSYQKAFPNQDFISHIFPTHLKLQRRNLQLNLDIIH